MKPILNYKERVIAHFEDEFSKLYIIGQNKIGKAIAVTDIAISKVPYVKYPDLSDEVSDKIYEMTKEVLKESRKNNNREVSITYNPSVTDEKNTAIIYGSEHEIDLGADTDTFHLLIGEPRSVINIHNHPDCSKFSVYDLSFFLRNDSIKTLVLVSNKGEVTYMTKNKNYDKRAATYSFFDACSKVNPKCIDLKTLIISFKGMSIKEMQNIAKIWTKTASEFGINITHVLNNIKEKTHEKQSKYDAERGIKIGDGYER